MYLIISAAKDKVFDRLQSHPRMRLVEASTSKFFLVESCHCQHLELLAKLRHSPGLVGYSS